MPSTSSRSREKAASFASAERLAELSEMARRRAGYFSELFFQHCKGKAKDEAFLTLLLDATLSPDIHPALAASQCLETIAQGAPSHTAPHIDPAPYLARLAALVSPPSAPPPVERDHGFSRSGPDASSHPWERLVHAGWTVHVATALAAAKVNWASDWAPIALANGADPELALQAAKVSGWQPESEASKAAIARCLAARDEERLKVAQACGAKAFSAPPHPMSASPLASLSGDALSNYNIISNARRRMGLQEAFGITPFFEKGMQALLLSSEWATLPETDQKIWAQRFLDDAFVAGCGAAILSPESGQLLAKHGAKIPSAWGTQRAVERALQGLLGRDGGALSQLPDAQCAKLIARARDMMPLLRAPEPDEPPIVPLCVQLIEFLGSDHAAQPATERAIYQTMDHWADSSFGARALKWMEAKSGQTHSAPNALCSLPRTKSRDFTEPASRWLGAFIAQGFDPQAKATPKSKSLHERVAGSKTLAPLYARVEAAILEQGSVSPGASSASAKPRL